MILQAVFKTYQQIIVAGLADKVNEQAIKGD
jgi:hypothetical protein